MDITFVTSVYVILDEIVKAVLEPVKYKPKMVPAEILLVAGVAARYFHTNLECALVVMRQTGLIPPSRGLSISRYNRQLHRYAALLEFCLDALMALAREGEGYIIDSMPAPVCKRKRAWHCRKVRGKDYCGFCAAKNEKFFGWRLHLICTPDGVPVTFTLLPALHPDLTPLYELTVDLPAEASLYGDKGYNTAAGEQALLLDGLRLIPIRKATMTPHLLVDENDLRRYRKLIETLNSQLESMGVEHLRAPTNPGFEIKIHSSLLAVYFTNAN
jgi:Transposase DDE domain